MGLLLGFIGAWLGSTGQFGFNSAAGWFIGSTIGSLLSLQNSHSTTSSGRITDFKSFNSKYGIPINRGYGTVRLAGNLIWRSPVNEVKVTTTRCIKSGGFLGIGGSRTCVSQISYQYAQSAAIAFAEGPAHSIQKIWADGEVVYDRSLQFTDEVRRLTQHTRTGNNIYNPYANPAIRVYLGTLTQKIDCLIKKWLGPQNSESGLDEAYAFRSIVYIVIDNLDLEVYGYRMPTFTAEVCFNGTDGTVYKLLETPTILSGKDNSMIGQVIGHPHLVAGTYGGDYGSGRRALWDIRTQELIFESGYSVAAFSSSVGIQMLSPDFWGMAHYWNTRNSHTTTAFNWLSGRVLPAVEEWYYEGVLGLACATYDPIRNQLLFTASLSARNHVSALPNWDSDDGPGTVRTTYEVGFVDPAVEPFSWLSGEATTTPAENLEDIDKTDFDYAGYEYGYPVGLAGRGGQIHMMRDGMHIWAISSSGLDQTFLNIGGRTPKEDRTFPNSRGSRKIRYASGTPVRFCDGMSYIANDDSIVILPGYTPAEELAGLYKVYLSDIDFESQTVYLPDPVAKPEQYLDVNIFTDFGGFQRGDLGCGVIAVRTTEGKTGFDAFALTFIDCINMEVVRTETFTGSGATNVVFHCITTLYFPEYDAAVGRGKYVAFFGGEKVNVLLSDIVEDLMTRVNGDDLLRLTSSDIDVSELTDEVRGFSLTRQQTIRSAVSQLMQGFFFDAVESDGKIKFKKRGRTPSFSLPEDDLRATSYGDVKGIADSVTHERRSEHELPRELVVSYADVDNDYLQTSQRARRTFGEADSNIDIAFQIIFDKDEAAQVADILLFDAWQEKRTNFSFAISTKHIEIEPSDVGTIVMHDGTTYRIRVVGADLGANGVTTVTAVEEFDNSYLSAVAGASNFVERNKVVDRTVMPVLVDITTRVLANPLTNAYGVIGGLTTMGSGFNGGKLYVGNKFDQYELAGVRGKDSPVTWGIVEDEIGHPNNHIATNVFDTETTIEVKILCGDHPVSGTTEEALSGQRLMIVGSEIVGYTTVTTTDPRTVVISNLLRGLFGTQTFRYHRRGSTVYFPENMFGIHIDPPELYTPIMAYAQGIFGGPKLHTVIPHQSNNVMPWNPVNVQYSGGKITWDRMDREYSDGIDPATPTELIEVEERYLIRHLDHNTAGEEGNILTQVESLVPSTSAISVPSSPIIVDIHQVNENGISHPAREVVSSTGAYSGGGTVTTASGTTTRWNAPLGSNFMTLIAEGPFAGASVLACTGSKLSGVEMPTGACKDIEVLARVYPSNNVRFTFGQQCGIYLRGAGLNFPGTSSSIANLKASAALIGFGSPSAKNFSLNIAQKGQHSGAGIIPTYNDVIDYDWDDPTFTYGRRFWIRGRFFGNRIQAKVWEDGESEPSGWQLEAYDNSFGPYFGSCGLFRYDGEIYCDYFSWAHRGGTAA